LHIATHSVCFLVCPSVGSTWFGSQPAMSHQHGMPTQRAALREGRAKPSGDYSTARPQAILSHTKHSIAVIFRPVIRSVSCIPSVSFVFLSTGYLVP
jgi:hypothetical protein